MNIQIDNVVDEIESSTPIHQVLTPINQNQSRQINTNILPNQDIQK